ncbi:PepSY-associated TM helix domain-containing protein [Methylomonas sp. UP202]|uniref:PepSY-associated TM helix domain-containing protein n=1 Tax=Methylomonas sp. UP202 TaxID=3040943 RepID=UPI0024793469|nr:PepSY-associated TM helix domain-containing protein [Methylomonas sp. UP202]WGS87246.1 PepSY-associated TM helix domain-containing protein [Methylomonas sp. UP202]
MKPISSNLIPNNRLIWLKSRRKFWLDMHLWLGLTLGFLLSIYGITGSILVFHAEIDEYLHPKLLIIEKPIDGQYRPLTEIFEAGRGAVPRTSKLVFATYPRNDNATFKLRFSLPFPNAGNEIWMVAVNPYTAEVTGKQLQRRSSDYLPATFINVIFALHYDLLMSPEMGDIVVGVSAALLIISILTGMIVWWPLTGRWRQALSIKTKTSKVRFNYDLHKTSGIYTALILIPILFSGVYLVLPHNVVPVLELFSPVTYRYWFQSTPPTTNTAAISMEQAVAIALQRYPQGRPHWIYGAPNPTQTYTVCQDGVIATGSLLSRRCTVIDRYSGKILDLDDPSLPNATVGEVFTHWQWPLHSGKAFGMTGRLLVFVTGLVCPILFVTGTVRWVQKRKAFTKNR